MSFAYAYAEYVPGRVVVRFKPGSIKAATVAASSVKALNDKYNITKFKQIYKDALEIYKNAPPEVQSKFQHLADYYLLTFPTPKGKIAASAVEDAVKAYAADANVISASPDFVVHAFEKVPTDPRYPEQWALPLIKAPQGWDRTTGSASNLVAVLDTGINYNHEEFTDRLDMSHAWNLVDNKSDPMDDNGHGTAISGVIAATANNGKGIAGMDWQVKILPIKVLDSAGNGELSNVTAGIARLTALKATGLNITVINMSLGQYNAGTDKYLEENPLDMKDRCRDAYNQGIILVAAAGIGNVEWNTYPAYYSSVLSVAATDSSDKRSVWGGLDDETKQSR
ncbi:S8 family serine peptidase, partial [Candidatus Saganbacteria bacterium]|nr:S8 family serine peptidase [Candidatus Saganbacteria bacterium]